MSIEPIPDFVSLLQGATPALILGAILGLVLILATDSWPKKPGKPRNLRF